MRELTLDDAFWRDVLAALRRPGEGVVERLAPRWPDYAGLIGELACSAKAEPCLVGGRPATAGKNPRLFLLLVAASLAREGADTLYLDLSSELRWLEMLTGEDLKEGLVDHLQYEVPLERCARPTALPGLSVLSGGAHFLAGSPLEDAPAFRAALETLRGRHDAVVVAFPHPFDDAESAGVTALCDAWIAVEEGEVQARLTGSERAVVQLVGDPQAAWDLARLSTAFLGPLPALLFPGGEFPGGEFPGGEAPGGEFPGGEAPAAGAAPRSRSRSVADPESGWEPVPGPSANPAAGLEGADGPVGEERESFVDAEELAFLRAFEGAGEPPKPRERVVPFQGWGDALEESAEEEGTEREDASVRRPAGGAPRRFGRGGAIAVAAIALVVVLLGVGLLADWFDPLLAGSGEEPDWAIDVGEAADDGGGTMVALDAPGDSGGPVPAEAAAETSGPDAIGGEPAPYSLHLGSYQSPESGGRVVRGLEAMGQTAFLAPVDLGEKGRWYRVYAGAFADSASAGRALESVLGGDVVEEGAVRHTPWAFRLGLHPTREAAGSEVDRLAGEGISAYAVGDGPSVVWAGAFRSEDEAAAMAAALEEAGVAAELVRRERPR